MLAAASGCHAYGVIYSASVIKSGRLQLCICSLFCVCVLGNMLQCKTGFLISVVVTIWFFYARYYDILLWVLNLLLLYYECIVCLLYYISVVSFKLYMIIRQVAVWHFCQF